MHTPKYICLLALLSFSSLAYAGLIVGSVSSGGKALSSANIQIKCGGAVTSGSTVSDGSFRLNVPQQGQCTLTLAGYAGAPSAVVFSTPNPSRPYDFELVQLPNGNYVLRKR